MTTFGDGLFQYGGMPVGGALTLPLMGGPGKAYFVDPANGSTSNDGLSPDMALASVGAAGGDAKEVGIAVSLDVA